MRFFNALIWLIIITVLFSGALYSLIYLDIPVGQGNPTENVSWYILTQDENNPLYTNDKLRFMYAEKFLSLGAAQLLIYLTVFWVSISLLWMVVGELLRIDRPNRSIRYIWLWFLFLIIILAPIFSKAINIPFLVGLRFILYIFKFEFLLIKQATIKKDALERSDGTVISLDFNSLFPVIEIFLFFDFVQLS